MPLPLDTPFGYVVGTFILAVGDTTLDVDTKPDAIPATGTVRFTPVAQKVLTTNPTATVIPKTVLCSFVNGVLVDPAGREGVWLVAGLYDVSYTLQQGTTLPAHRITVTEAHTEEAPLDLALEMPVPAPPAVQWVVNETILREAKAAADRAEAAAEIATGGGAIVTGDIYWMGEAWNRRDYEGAPHVNGQWTGDESGSWVDDDGNLHLKILRTDGVPHAVELISERGGAGAREKWGYGKYRWVVETPLQGVYSPVVLGLFTYDGSEGAPVHRNEIDVEGTGWGYGPQMWSGTYFREGLGDEPENRSVIAHQPPATTGPTVHEFEWVPGRITWRMWVGKDTTQKPQYEYTAIHGQPYVNSVISGIFEGVHDIPVPRNEELMMNLWVAQGLETYPPEDTPETEFVLSYFGFTPLAEMEVAAGSMTKVQVACTIAGAVSFITAEKDANGYVHLSGEFSHPNATAVALGSIIATLPVGFRPVSAVRTEVGVWDNGAQTHTVSLIAGYAATNPGAIMLRTGPWGQYTPISFTGITYKAY